LSNIQEEEDEGEEEDEDEDEEPEENLRSYRTFHYSSHRPSTYQTEKQELVVQDRLPLFATIV